MVSKAGTSESDVIPGVPYVISEVKLNSPKIVLGGSGVHLLLDSLRFPFVLMLLASLMLADGLITESLVNSGLALEGNPFMQGPLAGGYFMPVKVAGAWLSALILASIHRHHPKLAAAVAWLFIVVYAITVYWNIGGFITHLG